MFQESFKGVSSNIDQCFEVDFMVFQGSFKGISSVFERSFKSVSRVSRKFKGCLKCLNKVSRVLNEVSIVFSCDEQLKK